MQAYELVEILSDALNRLSKIGIKVTDFRHLAMYHEFKQLEAKGAKKEYIRARLSHKYKVSEQRRCDTMLERLITNGAVLWLLL